MILELLLQLALLHRRFPGPAPAPRSGWQIPTPIAAAAGLALHRLRSPLRRRRPERTTKRKLSSHSATDGPSPKETTFQLGGVKKLGEKRKQIRCTFLTGKHVSNLSRAISSIHPCLCPESLLRSKRRQQNGPDGRKNPCFPRHIRAARRGEIKNFGPHALVFLRKEMKAFFQ